MAKYDAPMEYLIETHMHRHGCTREKAIEQINAMFVARPPGVEFKFALAEPDLVNHPAHYTSHPSGIECITVVEHMGFNLGNAIKYIWRADEKGNALEDLEKARWYIERELQRRAAQ